MSSELHHYPDDLPMSYYQDTSYYHSYLYEQTSLESFVRTKELKNPDDSMWKPETTTPFDPTRRRKFATRKPTTEPTTKYRDSSERRYATITFD